MSPIVPGTFRPCRDTRFVRSLGHIFRVERARGPVWDAKYRLPDGRQVQKKIGPAWTERGRPAAGHFTKRLDPCIGDHEQPRRDPRGPRFGLAFRWNRHPPASAHERARRDRGAACRRVRLNVPEGARAHPRRSHPRRRPGPLGLVAGPRRARRCSRGRARVTANLSSGASARRCISPTSRCQSFKQAPRVPLAADSAS